MVTDLGTASRGSVTVGPGKALVQLRGQAREVTPEAQPLPSTAILERGEEHITGTAPALSQVFINGRTLFYPTEDGAVSARLPAGVDAPIVTVRDYFGRTHIVSIR